MREDGRAHVAQDRAERVGALFGDAGEVVFQILAAAGFFERLDRDQGLHQRLGRRTRLRDDEEARGAQVDVLQQLAEDGAVEAVDDMDARAAGARDVGGRAPEGELRQRLRAEAGAADA